jgi:hypothetical protein
VGTPPEVLEALRERYEDSNLTHLVLRGDARQLELMGAEMLPTMRSWGREPVTPTR